MSGWLSLCAGVEVLARTGSSSKRSKARESAQKSMCCPFIRAFAHAQRWAVRAIRAARLDKSSLAVPQASPRASAT